MTDSIDLDEIEAGAESEEGETPNHGDWFWRGEGDPDAEAEASDDSDVTGGVEAGSTGSETTVPHVPRENRNRPVGMPTEQGGAGGLQRARRPRTNGTTGAYPRTHRAPTAVASTR
ncbi:hypothetical protein [Halalkalicoccus salilacus]|uniref:hypothetical protein n=1 Tax=Halalkalicoccus sp. GCM10025704 TaxID=3252662 RepID=UPI003A9104D3